MNRHAQYPLNGIVAPGYQGPEELEGGSRVAFLKGFGGIQKPLLIQNPQLLGHYGLSQVTPAIAGQLVQHSKGIAQGPVGSAGDG